MITFKIFKPQTSNTIDIDWIFTISIIVSLLVVFIVNYYDGVLSNYMSTISTGFLIINFILIIIIGLISQIIYQPLNGDFDGEISFNSDSITIKETNILIADINKIEVFINDYKGMSLWYRRTMKPKLQQGVKNSIAFELISGETLNVNFLQSYKNEFQECGEYLKKYCIQGKIHFLHLIELLEITDYEAIQSLKIELNSKC